MGRALCLVIMMSAQLLWCLQENEKAKSPAPLEVTVEDLAGAPERYAHSIVKVRGCFEIAFERISLQPCSGAGYPKNTDKQTWERFMNQLTWVENAEYLEARQKHGSHEPELLFQYSAKKNHEAWERIRQSFSNARGKRRAEVVFTGQFESIAPNPVSILHSGFGHLNAYRHELILLGISEFVPIAESSSSPLAK